MKNGHHLYRSFDGHQILYSSLFKKYVLSLIDSPINRKGPMRGYHQCYCNDWKSEAVAQGKFQRKSSEVDRIGFFNWCYT